MSPVLDPRLLAATRGLTLAARRLAAGVLPGLHASRQAGMAREFSQYRAYQPGDDPRHVDWKLFARSDRYYVRESEIETAVTVRILLDATASMRHADTTGPAAGLRKFDAARRPGRRAGGRRAGTGRCRSGLHAVADGRKSFPCRRGSTRAPFERIVRTLERLEPAGRWPADGRALAVALASGPARGGRHAANRARSSSCFPICTSTAEEIRAVLAPLRARRHELLLFHLVGRDELDFPFHGAVRFEDWETGAAIETDADRVRTAWTEGQENRVREWRRAWEDGGRFDYAQFRLDEPLDRALRGYLSRRMGR